MITNEITPKDVYDVVKNFTDFILRYAITLVAISATSMALLEAVKALLSWRDRFHKQQIRQWINSVPGTAEVRERVYAQLIKLTTGEKAGSKEMAEPIEWKPWDISPRNALFAMELEKMLGQIQDAADTALGNPNVYPELYYFLSAGAAQDDINNWYQWAQQPPVRTADDAGLAKRQADTYARLRQFIRRRLDGLQLAASYRWATGNQIVSVTLGAVLLFGSLVYLVRNRPPLDTLGWLGLVFISLLGGILAPVAKDLVIALKRVRSGG